MAAFVFQVGDPEFFAGAVVRLAETIKVCSINPAGRGNQAQGGKFLPTHAVDACHEVDANRLGAISQPDPVTFAFFVFPQEHIEQGRSLGVQVMEALVPQDRAHLAISVERAVWLPCFSGLLQQVKQGGFQKMRALFKCEAPGQRTHPVVTVDEDDRVRKCVTGAGRKVFALIYKASPEPGSKFGVR